jgi:RNA polymerase sigma-70 factor (sigma-E family)
VSTFAAQYSSWVEAAWPRLSRTAYALTGDVDAADELLQEALVKLFVAWPRVSRADAPEAYAKRVLINLATSQWRSKTRRGGAFAVDPAAARPIPSIESHIAESDALWTLICGLPPRQRAVLVLRYYEDLSEQEIALALEIAPGTVKSLANAAMKKLRTAYAENERGVKR